MLPHSVCRLVTGSRCIGLVVCVGDASAKGGFFFWCWDSDHVEDVMRRYSYCHDHMLRQEQSIHGLC